MPSNDTDAGLIIGGLTAVAGGIILLIGWSTECRGCKSWFSTRIYQTHQLSVEPEARDIERTDKHYNQNGIFQG